MIHQFVVTKQFSLSYSEHISLQTNQTFCLFIIGVTMSSVVFIFNCIATVTIFYLFVKVISITFFKKIFKILFFINFSRPIQSRSLVGYQERA